MKPIVLREMFSVRSQRERLSAMSMYGRPDAKPIKNTMSILLCVSAEKSSLKLCLAFLFEFEDMKTV
jgi:hypothetical protein